jgi:hypothetical protein
MIRSNELRDLESSLTRLVEMLRLDPSSQWYSSFETHLETTKALLAGQWSQADLNALSASIMGVYHGIGSFNDYAPAHFNVDSGRHTIIPGAERFAEFSSEVHSRALALRTIGDAR